MITSYVNAIVIAVGSCGVALVIRLAAAPLVRVVVPSRIGTTSTAALLPPVARRDSLVGVLVERDPFRVTRRPPAVLYDAVRLAQPAIPPTPKPALGLVGIVWDNGKDPTALVEGIPGADGPRPVRQGETIAGLRVKTIKQDRVLITGLDTTWALTVREPWR
jgi:hypothetical protein